MVPDVRLVDQTGRRVSLADFRGRYLVLAPSMTLCHETCPMTTAVLEQVDAAVRRDLALHGRVVVATATVDPWRDTPARLRAYRRMTGVRFLTLTGSQAQIRRLWSFFGVYYVRAPQGTPADQDWMTGRAESFDVKHTDAMFIVDPQGHWRVAAVGMPSTGGRLSVPLRRLLNGEGQANLRRPSAPWSAAGVLSDLQALLETDRTAGPGLPPTPAARPAPASTALLDGGAAAFRSRLRALRGRPVVVNAWASWCAPCRIEFPLLRAADQRFGERVSFVGLNVNDNADEARAFLRRQPVGYPSYIDPDGKIVDSLERTPGVPVTVYFGRDGRRVHSHVGYYANESALEADIRRFALGS